jgi:sulfur relay protein TusB/DsrH
MSKLVVMNSEDRRLLTRAIGLGAEILLMRDAVYFTNNRVESNNNLRDYKVYALKQDVEKRGLADRKLDNVELIDMDQLVDLLFSEKTIINL